MVNEKGHYFDHKRKFRKTWSNTEYQPAKNQYQNSKKRLQFKRRQNCRPKCRQTKTPKSAYKYRLSNHQKTIPKLRKTPCFQNIAKSMANENSQKRHALRRNFTYQNSLSNTEYPKGEKTFEKNVTDVTVDKVFKLRTDRLIDRQQIPIYDMEAVAGLVPLFADQYSQSIVGSWRRH